MDAVQFAFNEAVRLAVIFLGFVAMWSLWTARRDRLSEWNAKMRDIWWAHLLFVIAAVEGNIELLYRHESPTAATLLFGFVMVWTIRGTFDGELYYREPCPHCGHRHGA